MQGCCRRVFQTYRLLSFDAEMNAQIALSRSCSLPRPGKTAWIDRDKGEQRFEVRGPIIVADRIPRPSTIVDLLSNQVSNSILEFVVLVSMRRAVPLVCRARSVRPSRRIFRS